LVVRFHLCLFFQCFEAGSYVLNNRSGNKERISRISSKCKQKTGIQSSIQEAGDTAAVVGQRHQNG
jgi:elongation factor G